MTTDAFDQTKTALLALGGHRVWSLMVTLFGDLAQEKGSQIEGPVLSAVMAVMDVRPEAVRVALHRLRNEGWIASRKQGRTGSHALTQASHSETLAASTRIYARPNEQEAKWRLILLEDAGDPPRKDMEERGFAQLMPRVYLGGMQSAAPGSAMVLTGGAAPQWLRQQISEQMLEPEYAALLPVLRAIDRSIPAGSLDALHTTALRCMIVHNWRRIVLRHPALPRSLLPDDWAGQSCHLMVDRLLTRFPRPPMHDILPS